MMQRIVWKLFLLGTVFLLFGYLAPISQGASPAGVPPEPVVFIKPDWLGPELDWSDFADENYTIYWQDQDVDDNAQITLFYDDDQSHENGNLGTIATGIRENDQEGQSSYVWNTGKIAEGSYVWNTTAVPNGAYYIGAIIADGTSSITSYSSGQVRVYHVPKISTPYSTPGLASIWSEIYPDNPELIHRHVYFSWDELEPCGNDNYSWEVNPASGRYYRDNDNDGVCENDEGPTHNRFKEKLMEKLYKKVNPACNQNCAFKQPLELLHPQARIYLQINGPDGDTLRYNEAAGLYEKGNYWLFNEVALLRTPTGDYNANGRQYPSIQFWAPQYKAHYQDLLEDFAAELKQYDEIYPYLSFVRVQFNAFTEEDGAGIGSKGFCSTFATPGECVDYTYDYNNYDPETRYNASLAKEYYLDEDNQQLYYYQEANDYHEWLTKTYYDIFKNDPAGKLRSEIVMKPFVTDQHFTPPQIVDGFLYKMVVKYGVWLFKTNMVATGFAQRENLTEFVRDKKVARAYTEPALTYSAQDDPINLVPARYDNPLQWVYWHALLDMHRGVDVISYYGIIISKCRPENMEYCGIFQFLNKYAGDYFSPATADSAWIAFRPLFHPGVLDGDLEMHMTQLDADNTSNRLFGYDSCRGDADCSNQVDLNPPKPTYVDCRWVDCPNDGYFGNERNGQVVSLGPKNQPYGIWARSIGANGKNVMTLDVNDMFAGSLSPGQGIKINVIYLDSGADTFSLKYKNSLGVEQTVLIDKNNSGIWKGDQEDEAVELWDFSFDNSLDGGDLQLLSNQDGEDIFHMVKVDCGAGPAILADPPTQAIDPGGVAQYTLRLSSPNLPYPVALSLSSPSPNLTLTLTPTVLTGGTVATLTIIDKNPGSTPGPGLWYTFPITGTGDGFTQTINVSLLIGGARTYLPFILQNDAP